MADLKIARKRWSEADATWLLRPFVFKGYEDHIVGISLDMRD